MTKWFTITDAWLMQHRSNGTAWTADQFKAIGISWPPAHGWKLNAIGRIITDTQKQRFEKAMRCKQVRAEATADLFR